MRSPAIIIMVEQEEETMIHQASAGWSDGFPQ
jgi:hypothetical protein